MKKQILGLLTIAVLIRTIISVLQIKYGISNQVNLDQYIYGIFNPGFEIYQDFYGYYVKELIQLGSGLIPYKDFSSSYPPLFLYTLYAFFRAGGPYAASIPIVLSDAATAPLVYLITRRITSERISFFAGLAYAASPFFLLYEGYLWLSSQPMTFLILLGVYLLQTKKPFYSSLVLGLAIMFNQEALVILPVYMLWIMKDYRKLAPRTLITIGVIVLIVSGPFLLAAPGVYINSMSYTATGMGHTLFSYASTSNSTGSSQSFSCLNLSDTWRSLVCNYGSLTYTDVKRVPALSVILSVPFLNTISIWLAIPLFAISFFCLLKLKRNDILFMLAGALATVSFVTLFALVIHSIYRYYLVPAYTITLAASEDRMSLVAAGAIPITSLFLPSGDVQLLPPLFMVVVLLMRKYSKQNAAGLPPISQLGAEKQEAPPVMFDSH